VLTPSGQSGFTSPFLLRQILSGVCHFALKTYIKPPTAAVLCHQKQESRPKKHFLGAGRPSAPRHLMGEKLLKNKACCRVSAGPLTEEHLRKAAQKRLLSSQVPR